MQFRLNGVRPDRTCFSQFLLYQFQGLGALPDSAIGVRELARLAHTCPSRPRACIGAVPFLHVLDPFWFPTGLCKRLTEPNVMQRCPQLKSVLVCQRQSGFREFSSGLRLPTVEVTNGRIVQCQGRAT